MIILARKSQDHSSVLARRRRCGRRAKTFATAYRPVWEVPCSRGEEKRYSILNWRLTPPQLLEIELCALPTWWFWRGGCTRSHSEHGRETPQRRWYSDLSHGRVGRCQVCKSQNLDNLKSRKAGNDRTKQNGPPSKRPIVVVTYPLPRGGAAR